MCFPRHFIPTIVPTLILPCRSHQRFGCSVGDFFATLNFFFFICWNPFRSQYYAQFPNTITITHRFIISLGFCCSQFSSGVPFPLKPPTLKIGTQTAFWNLNIHLITSALHTTPSYLVFPTKPKGWRRVIDCIRFPRLDRTSVWWHPKLIVSNPWRGRKLEQQCLCWCWKPRSTKSEVSPPPR